MNIMSLSHHIFSHSEASTRALPQPAEDITEDPTKRQYFQMVCHLQYEGYSYNQRTKNGIVDSKGRISYSVIRGTNRNGPIYMHPQYLLGGFVLTLPTSLISGFW